MSMDDEILQDFLSEAGELLDSLNEELIELEHRPDDPDLINKAFRAFHTIKGGAGFVGLDALVKVCHKAEEVFSDLRDGKVQVSAEMMDVLLQTLDVVNEQFSAAREGSEPEHASPELLAALASMQAGGGGAAPAQAAGPESASDVDAEFESMLGEVADGATAPAEGPGVSVPDAEPPEEEDFDLLIEQIRAGKEADAVPPAPAPVAAPPEPVAAETNGRAAPKKSAGPDGGKGGGGETVRVDVARLDAIMNLVGELVLVRNRLNNLSDQAGDTDLTAIAETLDRVTADVQTAVMESRLQPVRKVFSRFPRLVRDIARELDKPIELIMSGEDTELDKQVLDALSEPLIHLVRNALDHGIEMPDEREAKGKSREGHVYLSAAYVGDRVEIAVREDGRGLDAEKLKGIAVGKGVITAEAAAAMEEREAFELIFAPGFSTSAEISNISGRGVGMDAVRTKVNELNGRVEIHSRRDEGTVFTISVPLTLAILPTLMIKISDQRFALSLSSVKEVTELDPAAVHIVNQQPMLIMRGQPMALYRGDEYLNLPPSQPVEGRPEVIVVLELDTRRVGLVVDEIIGQEEAVMKQLGAYVRDLPGLGGGTVTGDGGIALILDVADLLRKARPAKAGAPVPVRDRSDSGLVSEH